MKRFLLNEEFEKNVMIGDTENPYLPKKDSVLVYLFSYIPCMCKKLHIFMYMDSCVCVYYERSKSHISLY